MTKEKKLPQFTAVYISTVSNRWQGGDVDMYQINEFDNGKTFSSLGVPHGRSDVVEHIIRACNSHYELLDIAKKRRAELCFQIIDLEKTFPKNSAKKIKRLTDEMNLIDNAIVKAEGK